MSAVFIYLSLVYLAVIILIVLSARSGHKWNYRNPYDRTCLVCGRNEVQHHLAGVPATTWWEVFNEGDAAKHRKGGAA